MKKILMLLLVCVCFYVSTVSAELYQNRDYNFQMDIPDGWIDSVDGGAGYLVNKKIAKNLGTSQQEWAGFRFDASLDASNPDTATTESFSPVQRKDILNTMVKSVTDKYPSAQPTYSDYVVFGKRGFLVSKFRINQQIKMTVVSSLFNRTNFFSIFVTGNSGQYEQQFFDMLKTLRPIVGNNDADELQEDVKYMRDAAEQEAIGALTSQPVTVKVK